MRIVGGQYRGTQLADLGRGDPSAHLRPTTDRTREAIFNLIAHGGYANPPPPQDMRVLDLFAGTGALGLEALSRGARALVMVDTGKTARKLAQQNIDRLGVADQIRLVNSDAQTFQAQDLGPFDLVFLDPPYGQNMGITALDNLRASGCLAPNALIVLEENVRIGQVSGFLVKNARKYADSWVHILIGI